MQFVNFFDRFHFFEKLEFFVKNFFSSMTESDFVWETWLNDRLIQIETFVFFLLSWNLLTVMKSRRNCFLSFIFVIGLFSFIFWTNFFFWKFKILSVWLILNEPHSSIFHLSSHRTAYLQRGGQVCPSRYSTVQGFSQPLSII